MSSCKDTEKQKQPLNLDGIEVAVKSIRFDQEVFGLDTNNLNQSINALGEKHPDFSFVYFNELTGFGGPKQKDFLPSMKHFLSYKDYVNLFDTVQLHFPDTKQLDVTIETLFRHIKYYYPEEKLGDVYYFISGLNFWSAVTVDSIIGVGLDMYLGKDYPFYAAVQIPQYEWINRMPEKIPVHIAKSFFESKFPFEYGGKTLLEMMLYKGKELYFAENVVRTAPDAHLMGYEDDDIEWCNANEALIYNFLIKKELLYATSWQKILALVNDGPTTLGMPKESPGNVGSWLGWQMVRSYMKTHPKTTLQQLMKLDIPPQQFLRESKFKP